MILQVNQNPHWKKLINILLKKIGLNHYKLFINFQPIKILYTSILNFLKLDSFKLYFNN
jgi:hypothetical protein